MLRTRNLIRPVLVGCGFLALGLGLVGLFLPIVPTVPFLLLAGWCFARGSTKLHRWLLGNPLFGRYLRDYQAGQGIPRLLKASTLLGLWGSVALSSVLWVRTAWGRALLAGIALAVTWHVLRQPTRQP